MILVTGGTGFIGQVLIRHLIAMNYPVRMLLRPSTTSPNIPKGVSVEAVICGLNDERGLRAAMKDVDVIYHLAGDEQRGNRADLLTIDINGTRRISQIAADAKVQRVFFLSHLGADRNSAYPLLRAKAHAEQAIKESGIPYTIFRSALVYGPNDHFTTALAKLIRRLPLILLLPGDGSMLLQPIWVEDLVICLTLALEMPAADNQTYSVGGPEYLPLREILDDVQEAMRIHRTYVPMPQAYFRTLAAWAEGSLRHFPLSVFWQDYLAADRTCSLDTLPRLFGLIPARFGRQLQYLAPPRQRYARMEEE